MKMRTYEDAKSSMRGGIVLSTLMGTIVGIEAGLGTGETLIGLTSAAIFIFFFSGVSILVSFNR